MNRIRPLGRIGVRLAAPAALLSVVLLVALALLQSREVNRRSEETLGRYAVLLNRLVLGNLHAGMMANDPARMESQMTELADLEPIREVRIVDKRGRVVYASRAESVGEMLSLEDPSCRACHRPGWEPGPGPAAVRFTSSGGQQVFRAVQSIVVDPECRACHNASAGEVLGILMTDLDDRAMTGKLRSGANRAVFLVAISALVILGVFAAGLRVLVVSRLRNLRDLLDLLRAGARSIAPGTRSRDEIDDVTRGLQALALDLDDQIAIERAARRLSPVLESHPGPVLLLDLEGHVAAANRWAAARFGGVAGKLVGRRRSELADPPGGLVERARENGWALPEGGAPGPIVVRLADHGGELLGYAEAWPEAATGDGTEAPPPLPPVEDGDWVMHAAAIVERVSNDEKRWRGIREFDRRLVTGKRLVGEMARAATAAAAEREVVDLEALGTMAVLDLQRELPHVRWHALLSPPARVLGCRHQLRALLTRLARAAAESAAPGGQVILFTQADPSGAKVFLGSWVDRPGRAEAVDPAGGPALADSIARAHGGGIEIDPGFDVRGLLEARGARIPSVTTGSLVVAELLSGKR